MKIICSCCARQIVDYCKIPDRYITRYPIYHFIGNQYCCGECGEDLGEYGLFPEERNLVYLYMENDIE